MKTLLLVVSAVVIAIVALVVALPMFSSRETLSYDDAAKRFAKGKFVTVDGKKVHYIEKGSGAPVILIHGFLYSTVMWKNNIDALAKKFKVYAIDLWGWGYSERLQPDEYSFEKYARQVIGFMDAMKIDKASLVGQSMGGGISVFVAATYPDRVNKLILIDPAVIPYPTTTIGKIYQLPYVGEFLNAIPGDALMSQNIRTIWFYDGAKADDAYIQEVLRPMRIKGSEHGMMRILRNVLKEPYMEPQAKQLAKIGKPILIIHGRQDKAVPMDRSEKLRDLWKGSELVIFDKAGHSPHEEYPDKFNALAAEFLSK